MAKKIITIALIFSLTLGQVIRVPTPLVIFAVFLVLLFFLQKPVFLQAKLTKPIAIFIGIGLVSLLINGKYLMLGEFLTSFLYLLRFGILAGVYFVVREFDDKTKYQLQILLAVAGVLIAVLGLAQYFFYPDLRNLYYAGWDEHLYRLFSTFFDPNFAGAFLVLVFILLMGLLLGQKNSGLVRFLLISGTILTLIAILLTYSRSAFLMFGVATTLLLLLLGKKKILLAVFLLFILGIVLLPKNLQSEGVKLFRTASISARGESVEKALIIFKDNPIFGVGFNAYRYAQKRYGFLTFQDWQNIHSGAGTDNSFLFVLATTGIVGFAAYLYLWLRILRMAFASRKIIAKVVIASSFGLFINSFFINSLFYESILVYMWIVIGIMERR